MSAFWKENWSQAQDRLIAWWHHEGGAFSVTAPKNQPWEDIPAPPARPIFSQPGFDKFPEILDGFPQTDTPPIDFQWTDPAYRFNASAYWLSRMFFGGEAFPYFDSHLGPGNLAAFLGSQVGFGPETVWFEPSAVAPDTSTPLAFSEDNPWWQTQLAILDYARDHAKGRFLVGMPDLSDNLDVLASLCSPTTVLMDMALNPDAIKARVSEIDRAYTLVFDQLYSRIKDDRNGNCFSCFNIWGPGTTTTLQCDLSAMFGPDMFADIVAPGLAELAGRYDHVLYHLDGSQALHHLDILLGIKGIDAIEWTPEPGRPWGGSPEWFDLYRKIRNGGKSVQAVFVKPEEAEPLLDALGPEGIFLDIRCRTETEARRLLDRLERFR